MNSAKRIRSEPNSVFVNESDMPTCNADSQHRASCSSSSSAASNQSKHNIVTTENKCVVAIKQQLEKENKIVRDSSEESELSCSGSVQSLPVRSNTLSLYDRTLRSLTNDINLQKEVALGKRIGFYRLGKELGSGNFSKVRLGVHVLTKEKVAVKILEKSKMDQKAQRLLSREIHSMEQTHHPNIIRGASQNARLSQCHGTIT